MCGHKQNSRFRKHAYHTYHINYHTYMIVFISGFVSFWFILCVGSKQWELLFVMCNINEILDQKNINKLSQSISEISTSELWRESIKLVLAETIMNVSAKLFLKKNGHHHCWFFLRSLIWSSKKQNYQGGCWFFEPGPFHAWSIL